MNRNVILLLIGLPFLIWGCTSSKKLTSSAETINGEELMQHIRVLSSDDFMGRKPFTIGEEKTIKYISEQYKKVGLQPGNNGSYFQEVPLVEITQDTISPMIIKGKGNTLVLDFKKEFVAATRQISESVKIEGSEMVFAGFGVIAPEYNWNDYAGLDVKGKTVVVLVNDPGFGPGNEGIFRDEAMTYYGRWTYKYEEAARQGAAGIIIVHETAPASYGWSVVENSFTGPQLVLQSMDKNMGMVKAEGWITLDAAKKLFAAAGMADYDFRDAARKPGFKPFSLGLDMSLYFENSFKTSVSNNVIGIYPGTKQANEYVIYTAHWDHLGVSTPVDGDSIYNGAVDNATGIAALIEIGEAFVKMENRPERTIVLLAVTAEEQGLLGSAWYAANPVFPPERTAAVLNMDAIKPYGKMKDVTIIGYGQSELDSYAKDAAEAQGRYIVPDPAPERGSFYRSDHFSFAKIGIPALYAKGGEDHIEKGKAYAAPFFEDYNKNRYHQPSDEITDDWDIEGVVQDVQLMYMIGLKIAKESSFPDWNKGSEFKTIREKNGVK